jgi:hypothetical protein
VLEQHLAVNLFGLSGCRAKPASHR